MNSRNDSTAKLYLTHRASLIDYATPIVGDRARAEDVVQEAFIRFAPSQRVGQAVEQPLSYLYRIVRNLALDWTRRRALEHRQQTADAVWWMVPPTPRTPEQEFSHREDVAHVEDILAGLPHQVRLAVEMHRLGGYTLQEVADHLGLSVSTAHRLVRDALVRIGSRLAPEEES